MRIAINGFGRIGRQILRLGLRNYLSNAEFVAINDLSDPKTMAHLLKYDSVHGTYPQDIHVLENQIQVGKQKIALYSEKDPSRLPWANLNIDVVLECTGLFRKKAQAIKHIYGGAKKVIISAPSSDPDASFVMGINEKNYDPKKHHIISNGSCTTNCLAMVIKVLEEQFGVLAAQMTTIHSYTNDQRVLDVEHKDLRRARAAALSMIPTTTGAADVIPELYPHLKGKMSGISIRVPTPNVSLVDLVATLKKDVTQDGVNAAYQKQASGALKKYLGFSLDPLVSSDYLGDQRSAIIDGLSTAVVNKNMVKVIAWYDNEVGFSARMLDLVKHICP